MHHGRLLDFEPVLETLVGECCPRAATVTQAQLSPVEFWGIIIAAAAGVAAVLVGAISVVQSHLANRDSAKRDEAMKETLDEMAEDIGHLTKLSEEAASRAPLPTLGFLIEGESKESAVLHLSAPARVDARAVLSEARQRANDTAPVVQRSGGWLNYPLPSVIGPTQRDAEKYEREVSAYLKTLGSELPRRDEWERENARTMAIKLRLKNDGAIPLEDARVVIRTPAGLTPLLGIKKPPKLPDVPRWRSPFDLTPIVPLKLHPENAWLVSAGFRPTAHDAAEWTAGDVQHGGHVDSEPLILAAAEPGDYTLEWSVHGDNLSQPETGSLRVLLAPPKSDESRTLATLKDVGLAEEAE